MPWKRSYTGIDLGAWSVKAVSITGRGDSCTLKAAAYMRLPKDARDGGLKPDALAAFLRSNGIKPGRSAVLMTGHSLMFRHMFLPAMPEKDLKEAVKWEIRKEVSVAPAELVADFVHSTGAKADQKTSIIAFAGVRKDIVSVMDFYKAAGIETRVIEVVPTSLLASFSANNKWEADASYAALDIGTSSSHLAIFKNRKLAFAREISMGGQDFTRAVQRESKKSADEAEEMKASAEATGANAVYQTAIERLSSELQRSFDYYQAQFREGGVSKLFLSGGSALLKGLDGAIGGSLSVHAFIDDPFRKIRLPNGAEGLAGLGPCFSVAVGLAMRAGAG